MWINKKRHLRTYAQHSYRMYYYAKEIGLVLLTPLKSEVAESSAPAVLMSL